MAKETLIFDRLCEFMNKNHIECVEDIYQRDSVNEYCVDFVAELVELMLEE